MVRASPGAAMIPTVNGMMTVGAAQLPGMMTGQILAGSSPLWAIRYQMVVVFMLAAATALGSFLFVAWPLTVTLTAAHQFRRDRLDFLRSWICRWEAQAADTGASRTPASYSKAWWQPAVATIPAKSPSQVSPSTARSRQDATVRARSEGWFRPVSRIRVGEPRSRP